jgi:hypothetical protein
MSNRAQRRAAERAAYKALRKQQRQNPTESRPTLMNTNETNTTNNSAQNAIKHGCCSESILIMKAKIPPTSKL